jgi:hypothetical protein
LDNPQLRKEILKYLIENLLTNKYN